MNATEFVRDKGWGYVVRFLNYDPCIGDDVCNLDLNEMDNLRRLVNSWELVESYRGLDNAKRFLSICAEWIKPSLEKAIQDVESVEG